MSKYRENNISVSGDGNAIGDGNHLTVVKNNHNHNHKHNHKNCSSSGGGSSDGDASGAIALGIASVAAMVVGSYLFALHAQGVYTFIQLLVGAEVAAALWLIYKTFDEDETLNIKQMAVAFISTLASAALLGARHNYRDELTSIAQAASSATRFWCGMSDYGRQLSMLHMVVAIAGFGLGSLLLAAPAGAMVAERFFVGPSNGTGWKRIERLSSWVFVAVSAILLLGAAYMHTESGWDTWQSLFGKPPAFFCRNAPVYGR